MKKEITFKTLSIQKENKTKVGATKKIQMVWSSCCQMLDFYPRGLQVKLPTFRYHRGQLKQETVTVEPIKSQFLKANSARNYKEDMHNEAYLHLPKRKKKPINQDHMKFSCV